MQSVIENRPSNVAREVELLGKLREVETDHINYLVNAEA